MAPEVADPDPMAEVAAHLTQLPGPVSDLRPDAPGGLVTLTTNLLANDLVHDRARGA